MLTADQLKPGARVNAVLRCNEYRVAHNLTIVGPSTSPGYWLVHVRETRETIPLHVERLREGWLNDGDYAIRRRRI